MEKLQEETARLDRVYGHRTGGLGSDQYTLNVVPTGILALDYALGIGGWPLGFPVEVFGPPDIGKSSVIGFNAIKNAQAMGKLCGIIALEPSFDKNWAIKNGVDPEMVAIARPSTGEDAFGILYDWVCGDLIDFIVFDSIGAVLKASEIDGGKETKKSTKAKANVGGQSSLVTWGVKRILIPAWKNNKGIIFLNQVRADMNSFGPGQAQYESPGGNALHHSSSIRIQLKPGRERYKEKIEGEEVVVGRQIVAVIKRNKAAEGSEHRAIFDYYQMDTENVQVGIDITADVINTAMKVGVLQRGGAWYNHSSFPDGRLKGREGVREFILSNPKAMGEIRKEVLGVMFQQGKNGDGT